MAQIDETTQIGADGKRYTAGEQPTDAVDYKRTTISVLGSLDGVTTLVLDEETGIWAPG